MENNNEIDEFMKLISLIASHRGVLVIPGRVVIGEDAYDGTTDALLVKGTHGKILTSNFYVGIDGTSTLGFYGHAVANQASAISDPAASIAGNNAAIDSILAALRRIGLIAT